MLSSTAMASLHACPKTLCTSSSFPPSNRFNTTSINRSSTLQTNLLHRRPHVFRSMASLTSRHRHNIQRDAVVGNSGTTVCFARISSTVNTQETTSVAVTPQVPPPSSQFGSPLFWIGVGVGLSALFTLVATNLKKYAMQQAFKTMMGQMNPQNNQFDNSAFSPTSPFPFPMPPTSRPATSPFSAASRTAVTVDVPMTKVEPAPVAASTTSVDVKDGTEIKTESITYETDANTESKKCAFVDVSPEEAELKTSFVSYSNVEETSSSKDGQSVGENGAVHKQAGGSSDGSQSTRPVMSVEALEKMMEDPTVQKMVFPHLPVEMRNPATFKWMLQNPEYRRQLEDMLANMGGSPEWDTRMMESLKNFDLSSPEVKQQFDQIGLTPEEVISKIMANPDVAMAFQNPRVQQAIMDCSQNPMSITKYQNDKEVMDVFNKLSSLFPGMSG